MADDAMLFAGLPKFKFFFIRLGLGCNGILSCPFAEAKCDPELVYVGDEDLPSVPLIVRFESVFRKGYNVLRKINNRIRSDGSLDEKEEMAANILHRYMNDKEKHAKCLNSTLRIMADQDHVGCKKTILTEALAVHLLGPLCPSHSFIINNKFKMGGKQCRCGCKTSVEYGPTGIGHEEVWHGFVDLMLLSTENKKEPYTSATVVMDDHNVTGSSTDPMVISAKRQKMDYDDSEEEEGEEESFGGPSITETKLSTSNNSFSDQVFSQTIVFAFLQRHKHPLLHNHLIPNIVISTHHFRIVMYDAKEDVLICSEEIPIFFRGQLLPSAIKALWLVLHYRVFCTGIPGEDSDLFKEVVSTFRQRVKSKLNIYDKKLKVGVSSFPIQRVFSIPEDNEVCDFIDWECFVRKKSEQLRK